MRYNIFHSLLDNCNRAMAVGCDQNCRSNCVRHGVSPSAFAARHAASERRRSEARTSPVDAKLAPEPSKGETPNLMDAFHGPYANRQYLFHYDAYSAGTEAQEKEI